MRVLFLGGTGPVGMSASRIALARGHEVVVAHSGKHEPGDLSVQHLHGERDALLAPGGPAAQARPDVIVDTRTTAENVAALFRCAREAGTQRLVIVSSTDVYDYFVSGSGDESAGGRPVLPSQTLPITEARRSGRRCTRGQHQAMTMRRWSAPWARRAATNRSRCCGRG